MESITHKFAELSFFKQFMIIFCFASLLNLVLETIEKKDPTLAEFVAQFGPGIFLTLLFVLFFRMILKMTKTK